MVAPAFAQNLTIVDPWTVFLNAPSGTEAIHDMTEFTDPADGDLKLVIAYGWEQGAPNPLLGSGNPTADHVLYRAARHLRGRPLLAFADHLQWQSLRRSWNAGDQYPTQPARYRTGLAI